MLYLSSVVDCTYATIIQVINNDRSFVQVENDYKGFPVVTVKSVKNDSLNIFPNLIGSIVTGY